jgi:hypothetical protein
MDVDKFRAEAASRGVQIDEDTARFALDAIYAVLDQRSIDLADAQWSELIDEFVEGWRDGEAEALS